MSITRPRLILVLVVLAAALLAFIAMASAPINTPIPSPVSIAKAGDRKDCADFSSQRKAQRWFKRHNPQKDPSGLDADNDGVACEDNPCPCNTKPAFAHLLSGLTYCGDKPEHNLYGLKTNIGCSRGFHVALHVHGDPPHYRGFRCSIDFHPEADSSSLRCRNGGNIVRFGFAA